MKTVIALDYETSVRGKADWRVWRDGFQVESVAISWRGPSGALQSRFYDNPAEIRMLIEKLSANQTPVVVHNLQFETAVTQKCFGLPLNFIGDTMRLAKLRDGGGDWRDFTFMSEEDRLDLLLEESHKKTGLSLEACASRFLGAEHHGHKQEAYQWLETNRGIKTKHGGHLHLLPRDLMIRYNTADTEITLRLWETLTDYFKSIKFDWVQDWGNYKARVQWHVDAYLRGIQVDREALAQTIIDLEAEIEAVERAFREGAGEVLVAYEKARGEPFNVGSNKQLKELLVERLGIVPTKTTAKGEEAIKNGTPPTQAAREYPSFASKHLATYGKLGEILLKRRKTLLVLQQTCGAYLMSAENGRVFPDVKSDGTKTNRVSGGYA